VIAGSDTEAEEKEVEGEAPRLIIGQGLCQPLPWIVALSSLSGRAFSVVMVTRE